MNNNERKVRFNLTDINPSKIKTNAQGGIVVEGVVIKTGVFVYQTADGGNIKEYLPAEEIFKEEVMNSMRGAPVTNEHPDQMISPDNFKNTAVGFVQEVRNEGNKYLVASLIINDKGTIQDIVEGKKRELSAGYFTEPVKRSGVSPSGERFDVIQTDIVFNHCSLVEMGRCGPDVSLRLNSKGNLIRMSDDKPLLKSKSVKKSKANAVETRTNIIREKDGEYCVFSKDGEKNFGCYKTQQEAEDRLRQIHAFAENEMGKENKENAMHVAELVAVVEGMAEAAGLSPEALAVKLVDNQDAILELLAADSEDAGAEDAPADETPADEALNSAAKKKAESKANSKPTKAEKELEEKFNKRVEEEVETRMGLLIAAKQLGVGNLKPTIPAPELRLMIVQTTKPHLKLDGRSEDYVQALLEDSLANVDIASFWTASEQNKEPAKTEEVKAAEEGDAETPAVDNLDFDGMPDDLETSATLNSLLETVRSKSRNNEAVGKTVSTDIYSTEERARLLVNWQGKKLL